jgi:hypothetical protein
VHQQRHACLLSCKTYGLILPFHILASQVGNFALTNSIGAFTSLDEWFSNAPQIEMNEDAVGLGNCGKTLTFLFYRQIN